MCLLDCKFAQASHLMGNRFNGVLPITISSASSLEIASERMSCEDLAIFFAYRISSHGLRTPNEAINQRNLKIWADVADKICFGHT